MLKMKRTKRENPTAKAVRIIKEGKDQEGFDIKYISKIKGYGVFTSKSFQKGDFLLEYAGDLLCKEEADLQEEKYLRRQRNSLYPRCFMYYFRHNDKDMCIDATNMCGRAGSLVNDSDKDANCAVKKVVVDGRCHLAIFAKADIDIGAELLYDYGDATNLWWRKDNNNERDAMLEKYMWAKLPGIPKKMKWPVQVKSVYEDQKQANVYCLADDRNFRVSLDDIECISHKEWEDIGIECLKKMPVFLNCFRHDLSWAREGTAVQHPQQEVEYSTQPMHDDMVQPTEDGMVRPLSLDIVQSTQDDISTQDDMVQPSLDGMIQPSKNNMVPHLPNNMVLVPDDVVQPLPDENVQPSQDMQQPLPYDMVQPTQDDILQPTQDDMLQPTQDDIVHPTQHNIVQPLPDYIVQPTPDGMVHPTKHNMVQPFHDITEQPLQDDIAQPTQDDIVQPTQDDIVQPTQPTQDDIVQPTQPTQDDIVQPTQNDIVQPTQNDIVQPTQNEMVQLTQDDIVQPTQNEMVQTTQDNMVHPTRHNIVQPLPDNTVQPLPDYIVQPTPDGMVHPTKHNMVQPFHDITVQPLQDDIAQPTQDDIVQPTQDDIVQHRQDKMVQPTKDDIVQSTQDEMVQPTQDDIVQPTQPTQDDIVQPTRHNIVQPTQDDIVQPTQNEMVQLTQDDIVQPTQPTQDNMVHPARHNIVQPTQDELVQPTQDELVQLTQDDIVQPTPDGIVQSTQDEMVQPTQDDIVQPTQDELVQPTQDEMVHPTQDEMVQPTQDDIVQPTQDEMVLPTQDEMVHPIQDDMVQPTQDGIVHPTQDGIVQPTQDDIVQPTQDELLQPTQDEMVQPTQDEMVHPTQDEMVHPTPDGIVQPTQDEMVHPIQDDMVQPTQDDIVQPTQDDIVQPTQDEMVQHRQDDIVQPTQDELVHPTQDEMVHPTQDEMVQHRQDDIVQPTQDDIVQPTQDDMVQPTQDDIVQPTQDDIVQPTQDDMVQPTQDDIVQHSHDENLSDFEQTFETDSDKVKDPDYVVTDSTSDEYDSFSNEGLSSSFKLGQKRKKRFTKRKRVKKPAVPLNPVLENTFMDKANFVEDSFLSNSDTNMPYNTKPLYQSLTINDSFIDDAEITNSDGEMSDSISIKNGLSSNLYPNVYILQRGEKKEGCKQIYDKKNYCTFCEKEISSKISRHLLTVHRDRTRVSELLLLPKKSKERLHNLELLANEGNFKHNINVLQKKEGCLVVARRDGYEEKRPVDYLPCEYCKKFILRTSLWWHNRNCCFRGTGENASLDENETSNNAVRHGQHLLRSALQEETDSFVVKMLSRMKNDTVKAIVEDDSLLKRYAALRVDSLGEEGDQKINDMYRVSQCCRTLARLILEAKKMRPETIISLDYLVRPENFDLVVECTKALSLRNDNPALTLGKFIGNLLNHVVQIKVGHALRENDDRRNQDGTNFQKLMKAEWNYRVNSVCLKRINAVKRTKVQTIPLTDDLKKLVAHIQTSMETSSIALTKTRLSCHWTDLAQLTMCRLILFNKRRRAEVKDLKVCEYLQRPNWKDEDNGEFGLALSEVDRLLADRMDMVISAGKSRKNVNAYVILPPDAKSAIDLLIKFRKEVGIPETNPYIFARLNADTPFSGNTEMAEIVSKCPGLQHPERITSTSLRKYIATVSQILDMTTNEFEMLANHLGHDVKTHKENYRLSHSTVELTKVSHLLLAVESGQVNKWKGKKLEDITLDELPVVYEEGDVEVDEEMDVEVDKEDVEEMIEQQGCSGDTNEGQPKRKRWTPEETNVLRKKFKMYLDNTKNISIHRADLIEVQKTCPSLQLRTLAQIRAKLNNIKLGKST